MKTMTAPPAPSRTVPVLERRRGTYKRAWFGEGYVVFQQNVWEWDEHGDMVTSALPHGMHAPVLDVDIPVTVERDTNGIHSYLSIPNLTTVRAARIARKVSGTFGTPGIPGAPQTLANLTRDAVLHPRSRVTLHLTLALTIEALPSKTAGNQHLYVQNELSWRHTAALVRALDGVVDPYWAKACLRRPDIGLVIRPVVPNPSPSTTSTASNWRQINQRINQWINRWSNR